MGKTTAQQAAPAAKKMAKPAGHSPMGKGAGAVHGGGMVAGAGQGALGGKVLETMDAGGYTYVKLDSAKGHIWAAVRKTTIKVGQDVGIANPMLMKKFESKTLKRTFDEIYFGRLRASGGGMGMGHKGMGGKGMGGKGMGGKGMGGKKDVHGSVSAAHAGGHKLEKVAAKVEKAKGGHTVVEIFTKRK
ncbi:MAG: hypothetical protein JRH20_24335, partial [Deltaproteobacteria bacterium]|nr:hypothetical protein [Deltaproteobacteria bacterium]